ncbi:MAG: protein kinase [Gaiellaceae bacterium]
MDAVAALPNDELVLGRYRPVQPLGSGGSGSVWLARDEVEGGHVALKIVAREGKAASRAEREASAAARLDHDCCLRARDFASDDGHVYIAYEYVPGQTFRHALRAGELDDESTVEAAAQILDGLAHAHAHGIVHRDVKPSNVLLADDEHVSVRLLDFGLAVFDEADTLTAAGDVPGTLAYISPERLKGETAGPAADVWAVGVLLWESLAGWHPFWTSSMLDTARRIQEPAPSLALARPDLPTALVAVVDRALSRDPRRRPSATRMAAAVRSAWRSRARRRDSRSRGTRLPAPGRVAAVGLAALVAGWAAATLPFYPDGSAWLLAAAAAALTFARERAGLAFALAVPVLPLGNLSAGLALAYTTLAFAWLALAWRDPRSGLAFAAGPLLVPVAALGLLPLALIRVRNPLRRAAQAAAGVLAALVVAGVRGDEVPFTGEDGPARLALHRTESGGEAVRMVLDALSRQPALVLEAFVLAAAAAALPYAARRGAWPLALTGGALLAAALTPASSLEALPLVVTTWATCLVLGAVGYLRERRIPPARVFEAVRERLPGSLVPVPGRAPD